MKFSPTLPLLIAFLLMATPAMAETEQVAMPGATAEVYKTASGDDLHIYRFDPEGHDPARDKRPAAVFFFGGGWNGGTVTQLAPQSRYLASRGIVAFVADYRVKSRQKVTPDACVEDGKSAIRWVRQNSQRLGIDPEKIIAGGGSAGGHVAAATGICEGFEAEGEDHSVSSKPNALILFNPVYDNAKEDGYGYDRIKEWFPAISPAHNITPDDPPAVVFLGTKDNLVPVTTAEAFRDKMIAAGIQTELHLYKGRPHGFFNPKRGGFNDTLAKTDQFLAKLGYLNGPVDHQRIEALNVK
ncbi:MAG: alpha/beta hydrolase [bacterium]|nr:alpha/beta hydrolase [bacterium]